MGLAAVLQKILCENIECIFCLQLYSIVGTRNARMSYSAALCAIVSGRHSYYPNMCIFKSDGTRSERPIRHGVSKL